MSRKILLSIFFVSTFLGARSQAWTELPGPYGGTVVDYIRDASSNIYAITDGCAGIFKSTDGGVTWAKSGLSGYCINDLYRDGSNLYALDYGSLYKSTDGITWTRQNPNSSFNGGRRVIKSPTTGSFFVVGEYWGVYRSTDAGVTFTKMFDPNALFGASAIDITVKSTGDIFVSTGAGMFRSLSPNDGSAPSWTQINTGITGSLNASGIAYDGSGNLYCATTDNLYKSTNNGTGWSSVKGTLTQSNFRGKISVSPTNTIFILNESSYVIHKSINGGSTWTTINSPIGYYFEHSILVIDDNNILTSSWQQGAIKTTNGGTSWTISEQGLTGLYTDDMEVASNGNILVNPSRQGIIRSSDNGLTWTRFSTTPMNADFSDMYQLADGSAIFATGQKLVKTLDGGASWILVNDLVAYGTNFDFLLSNDGTTFYAWGSNYTIYTSINQGVAWTPLNITGLPASWNFYNLVLTQNGNLFMRLYNNGNASYEIYKITAGTATKQTYPPTTQYIEDMESIGNDLFVRVYSQIYKSSDGAVTWTNASNGTIGYRFVKTATGKLMTHGNGVSVTDNSGASWSYVAGENYWIGDAATVSSTGFVYGKGSNTGVLKSTSVVIPLAASPAPVVYNWQHLPGPYGGYIYSMTKDGLGNVYGLSNNQIYKLPNGSTTWQKIGYTPYNGNNYEVYNLIVGTGNRLIANGYNTISFSTDGGTTWTQPSYVTYFNGGYADVRESGSNLWIAGYGAWLSTDNGVNWTMKTPDNDYLNAMEINSSGHIYVARYSEGVSKSTDNGANWTLVNTGITTPTTIDYHSMAIDASNNIYLLTSDNIYKTTNGGTNWTSIKGSITDTNFNCCSSFISVQGTELYLSYSNKVYKSTDGGSTWIAMTIPGNFGASGLVVNGSSLILNRNDSFQENMYVSTNGGTNWTPLSTGLTAVNLQDIEVTFSGKVLVGDNGCGTRTSIDNGITWPTVTFSTGSSTGSTTSLSDGTLFSYGCGLQKSTNFGTSWTALGTESGWNLRIQNDNTFFKYDNAKFFKSTNQGGIWTELPLTGWPAGNIYYIDYTVSDVGDLYLAFQVFESPNYYNNLYKVAAGSNAIVEITIPNTTNVNQVKFFNGKLYVRADDRLYTSTDAGTTWTSIGSPSAYWLMIDPGGRLFIKSESERLYSSINGGLTWQNISEPGVTFSDVMIDRTGYAYASTRDAGVLKSNTVVLPNDGVGPVGSTLLPLDNATNTLLSTNIEITFDEVAVPVASKKLFVYQVGTASPVFTVDVTALTQKGNKFVFDPATSLTSDKDYYVNIEAGAFADIFGNTFLGITNTTAWNFKTIKETDPPVVTHTPKNIDKSSASSVSQTVTITDVSLLASVKVFYRGITSTSPYTEKVLNAATGSQDFTMSNSDVMGLEYYFVAVDNIGNGAGIPSTKYYCYIAALSPSQVAIPNLKFGGTINDWDIITIPHELSSRSVTAIFDELGPYDIEKWRLITYKDGKTWSEFNEFSTMEKGRGYFINIATSATVNIDNSITPNYSEDSPFSFTLKSGWNQIGNPYMISINWPYIMDNNTNVIGVGSLIYYNAGFKGTTTLAPFEGAFVQCTAAAIITVPLKGQPGGRKREDFTSRLDAENWKLDFKVTQGDISYDLGAIGMHPEANISRDKFDQGTPPRFFNYLELNFDHPEFFLPNFTQDIVPTASEHAWSFDVNAEHEGNTVISWKNESMGQSTIPIYLVDPVGVEVVDMRVNDHYSFSLSGGTRKLEVYYGMEPVASLFRAGNAYPTPFSDEVKVPFSLPQGQQSYQVSLEVYNSIGQRIGQVAGGMYGPGYQEIKWDGSAPDGADLKGGLYFFTLVAHSAGGSQKLNGKLIKNH